MWSFAGVQQQRQALAVTAEPGEESQLGQWTKGAARSAVESSFALGKRPCDDGGVVVPRGLLVCCVACVLCTCVRAWVFCFLTCVFAAVVVGALCGLSVCICTCLGTYARACCVAVMHVRVLELVGIAVGV